MHSNCILDSAAKLLVCHIVFCRNCSEVSYSISSQWSESYSIEKRRKLVVQYGVCDALFQIKTFKILANCVTFILYVLTTFFVRNTQSCNEYQKHVYKFIF